MFITDLQHFIGIEFDTHAPAPARRLAEHLTAIVRAATAAPDPSGRLTAIRCRRRPGRVPCPGPVIAAVVQEEPPAILWGCVACDDQGSISGWEGTPYDLTPDASDDRDPVLAVVIPDAAYRSLLNGRLLLDRDCERVLYAAEPARGGVELCATEEDWEQLHGFVAAEANHATSRRQAQLDEAIRHIEEALDAARGDERVAVWRASRQLVDAAQDGVRRRGATADVEVPELTRRAAAREVARWCERRIPLQARHQVRLEVEARGGSLTIVERRLPFMGGPVDPAEWVRSPVAQLRWSADDGHWRLHWCDRNHRWRPDRIAPPSPDIGELLRHLDADPQAVYWG